MKERIAILGGVRTPIGKAGGVLSDLTAVELGTHVVKETLARTAIKKSDVDELIMGNVAQPVEAANVSRVIALRAGLDDHLPAFTVQRNCASGMQAITSAAERILAGGATICIAGGVEAMSQIPLLYNEDMTAFFYQLSNKRLSSWQRLNVLMKFRPRYLKPTIGVVKGLTDPVCGLNMGQTAEVLAREFKISRSEQDHFALASHRKAIAAERAGHFATEIHPIFTKDKQNTLIKKDEGPRSNQSLTSLAALKPYFDRRTGTVTVGNACSINDGAAAVVLMREKEAKRRKLPCLGYLTAYSYAALPAHRMGLGPIYATHRLLKETKLLLKNFDLIEINEAFAAQVLANIKAFTSKKFSETYLNTSKALGSIDESKLNVSGGAIALGHPVGMSGTRLVIHILNELQRRKKRRGLATLCVGGGQGAALYLESS
ncbi:acetyl-CoA acetyltransferase [Spirochaetota bacterium]|nr:acetyl-CoA acetyltransferase [Spirochaetota bacterium]